MSIYRPTPTLHRILRELMVAGSLRDRETDTHLTAMRDCLEQGASLTEFDPQTGLPPLAMAAISMRAPVVQELVLRAADKTAASQALAAAAQATIDPDRFAAFTAAQLFLEGDRNAPLLLRPAPSTRARSTGRQPRPAILP